MTGLDPDPRVRRRPKAGEKEDEEKEGFQRKQVRQLEVGGEPLPERGECRRGERRVVRGRTSCEDSGQERSGSLDGSAVKEMQGQLLDATGSAWGRQTYSPPVLLPEPIYSPLGLPPSRKTATASDVISQRSKAIEMMVAGSPWHIARRVEIVPPEKRLLSSRSAAKESREEQKARNLSKGKGKTEGQGQGSRKGNAK